MNILYLSERDPRDTHFGGAQRTNYIWRALQHCGEVYSIFFDQQFKTEEISPRIWHGKKLQKVNVWQYFWYRAERKILEPFNVLPFWPLPTKLEKNIEEIFPVVKFDVVVCRYCFDLAEMHLWNFPRVYVDFDDHPLEMYDSLKSLDVKPWLRPLGRWILKQQMKVIEKKISGGWISNSAQIQLFKHREKFTPLQNISKSPSVFYKANLKRKPLLMTVGAMSYAPNYMGVDIFLSEIWPEVHNKFPDLEFAIVGKDTPKKYTEQWAKYPNVKLMGFVENLETLYQDSLCSVVSIYKGGGTCIKVLESLAYSRVCLATPFGARGAKDELKTESTGIFIYQTSSEFIQLLKTQILDKSNRLNNERSARAYFESNCSFESFKESVNKLILE